MTTGQIVLVAALVLALGLGLWRLVSDGRFRGTHRVRAAQGEQAEQVAGSVLAGTPYDAARGERGTLLQFSSAFCAPCRATRQVLSAATADSVGVAHVEVDAEQHLDLVRRLGITRTPTTLVLDGQGAEIARATGAPTRDQVRSALDALATSGK